MRYASNLTAPDLASHFALRNPPIQILGHDMPSDPDFEPDCGFWTHDEAAILSVTVGRIGGDWLDIGSRMGWTAAHIAVSHAVEHVWCIDQGYSDPEFLKRGIDNMLRVQAAGYEMAPTIPIALPSRTYLTVCHANGAHYRGFVIDACHDSPEPLEDAKQCHELAEDRAVIILHDAWGWPVQDAAQWLMDHCWRVRLYNTPNGVLLCWRGDFAPPDHVPDSAVNWDQQRTRITHLDLARCE